MCGIGVIILLVNRLDYLVPLWYHFCTGGTVNVQTKGIDYKIKLMKVEEYKLKFPGSMAHVHRYDREIIFRDDHVKLSTIIHEVCHAFINTLCLGSCTDLSVDDFEEIICEMMEDHIIDIQTVSKDILKFLQKKVKKPSK